MSVVSSKLVERIILSNDLIRSFKDKDDFSSASEYLLNEQKKNWSLLNDGYNSLKSVKIKSFEFDGFKINIQLNPNRIISSSANVDEDSVKKRKCFLCVDNLPEGQRGIFYSHEYIILANPYPIFPEHFTIANINHFPQRIDDIFYILLALSRSLSKKYTVFYNGPKCGASAPDHLHFQAGNKYFMPVENEFVFRNNQYAENLYEESGFIATAVDDGLRRFISFEGEIEEILIFAFGIFFETYRLIQQTEEEPLLNILSSYEEGKGWHVIFFLRDKHRPSHFYAEGENNILLSPAAVDMGGVCITPRENDFIKITKENLIEIFNEVSLGKELFDSLKSDLKENLKKI
jgi:hypothetical protein